MPAAVTWLSRNQGFRIHFQRFQPPATMARVPTTTNMKYPIWAAATRLAMRMAIVSIKDHTFEVILSPFDV